MASIARKDAVMIDDDERTMLYDVDETGAPVNHRTIWKPGSTGDYQAQIRDKLTQARAVFESNVRNWPTMTAQQKDTANRQAQRAVANLLRWTLEQFDSPGE